MSSEKQIRQALICRLIKNNDIPNQKTLMDLLLTNGVRVTQATISRDLLDLGITKKRQHSRDSVPNYRLPEESPRISNQIYRIMGTKGFKSIHTSGQLSILKTRSGYAHSICVDIDTLGHPSIIGTIAGDDTILIVHAENATRNQVIQALGQIIPELLE